MPATWPLSFIIIAAPDYAGRVGQFAQDWSAHARDKGGAARMASAVLALLGFLAFVLGATVGLALGALVAFAGAVYVLAAAAVSIVEQDVRRALEDR